MFLKFHDSHSSPYCYEEQISTVQISKLNIFWCVSSFSVWIMGFSGSQSAGTELGIWGGVTDKKRILVCFLHTHLPFTFPNRLKLQLVGLPIKWFCLWQTLIYWLCQGLVTKNSFAVIFPFGGRTVTIGRRLKQWMKNFLSFGDCANLTATATISHLFRCSYETPWSQDGPRLLLMRVEGYN